MKLALLALALFTISCSKPRTIDVYVFGAISQPGKHAIAEGTSLSNLLSHTQRKFSLEDSKADFYIMEYAVAVTLSRKNTDLVVEMPINEVITTQENNILQESDFIILLSPKAWRRQSPEQMTIPEGVVDEFQ
jgi:hypothetical protein